MNKLIEKFRCQEYLGEKYQLGLYHPHEAWMIFENRKSYVSDNGQLLVIGETFDDNQVEFCYRASQDGIWAVTSDGDISLFADRLHEMVEGWHPESVSTWNEMDTISRWKSTENYLQHHQTHYNWNIQPLIDCVQRWTELDLNKLTSIAAEKNHMSISLEKHHSEHPEKRSVFVGINADSNKYRVSFRENQQTVSAEKIYDAIDLTQCVEKVHNWFAS